MQINDREKEIVMTNKYNTTETMFKGSPSGVC